MNKVKLLTILVAGLLLVNLGLLVFLFTRIPPPGIHNGPGFPPDDGPKFTIIQKLHFDKDQVIQYEKLIVEHQARIKQLEDNILAGKNQLYATLVSDSTSKDSVMTRLTLLKQQIEAAHYSHFQEIKKICHPDQLADYKNLTRELAAYFLPKGRRRP